MGVLNALMSARNQAMRSKAQNRAMMGQNIGQVVQGFFQNLEQMQYRKEFENFISENPNPTPQQVMQMSSNPYMMHWLKIQSAFPKPETMIIETVDEEGNPIKTVVPKRVGAAYPMYQKPDLMTIETEGEGGVPVKKVVPKTEGAVYPSYVKPKEPGLPTLGSPRTKTILKDGQWFKQQQQYTKSGWEDFGDPSPLWKPDKPDVEKPKTMTPSQAESSLRNEYYTDRGLLGGIEASTTNAKEKLHMATRGLYIVKEDEPNISWEEAKEKAIKWQRGEEKKAVHLIKEALKNNNIDKANKIVEAYQGLYGYIPDKTSIDALFTVKEKMNEKSWLDKTRKFLNDLLESTR